MLAVGPSPMQPDGPARTAGNRRPPQRGNSDCDHY